ncbi:MULTISPECIES: hypothetical protein [Pseudomonas syringae group]|uniref:hypothetical protein n=1 Tax=Pseudomonas syringae group TaxID=136849 RepID=UPI0006D5FA10|nr:MULTISPECIES: hypothetical protein [Pseudomonas syringae group]KPZ26936.1 Uncharacterized protein ALO38_04130 [Pseudomonas coronafaciens pv. zizaniae]RMN37020.1 hypothetical protein ALQ61_03940 [Pseudomonas coronafaciens pv. zizaniae]
MQVLVIPMRRKGVALEPRERERYEAIQGNVIVRSTHSEYLGRHSTVAWIDVGMPKEEKGLPELLDVTLATMAQNGFVLSGVEYIDGCAYAQSWWCRYR